MHVVATAGHVDHGKSTLVRALTGMEPDRWAEEQRRGMTIDLGFAWTSLPSGQRLVFVDVPGHERFIVNTLAGVGPAPALMLVVAADEGWMPQTEEHVRAARALGAARVLLVVTKTDLAPAAPTLADATRRLREHGWPEVAHAGVSATTQQGLADVRVALDALVAQQPSPRLDAPVRLWVDRSFTIRGAGTVVTGTLPAGRIRVGDTVALAPSGREVVVRGLQSLQEAVPEASAVARVAVNLRGVDRDEVRRGMALVTPAAWTAASEVDVVGANVVGANVVATEAARLPEHVVVHVGSAAVPARVRALGGLALRLRLAHPLPLHLGDRLLVRDPATRVVVGADVADLAPRPLRRRGDAGRLATSLRVPRDADDELARHPVCMTGQLVARGLDGAPRDAVRVGDHWVAASAWQSMRATVAERVAGAAPLDGGVPLPVLARELGMDSTEVVVALIAELPGVRCVDGRAASTEPPPMDMPGFEALLERFAADPFDAPDASALAGLGLSPAALAPAVRAGVVVRIADGIYLSPAALDRAVELLRELDQPFTVAAARTALGSTRRVVVPLLEHLDATRRTRRQSDGTRYIVTRQA